MKSGDLIFLEVRAMLRHVNNCKYKCNQLYVLLIIISMDASIFFCLVLYIDTHIHAHTFSIETVLIKTELYWLDHALLMKDHQNLKTLLFGNLAAGQYDRDTRLKIAKSLKRILVSCSIDYYKWVIDKPT